MRIFAVAALAFALGTCMPAAAAEQHPISDAAWKFSRGVVNTATGLPGEMVAHTILRTSEGTNDGAFGTISGALTGLFVGTGWGVVRMGSGVFDMFTFAVPVNDNKPLLEPEFAF